MTNDLREQQLTVSSDLTLQLVDSMGNDESIARAAKVSVQNSEDAINAINDPTKLITYLMKQRHGTPFEHNSMTFYVKCPIFVSREWFRHRIGWSYNETSGRYRQLEMEFYVPPPERPCLEPKDFKPARPQLTQADSTQYMNLRLFMMNTFEEAEHSYAAMLEAGIGREVARNVLPLAMYTHFFATCNVRSVLAFLSLRTHNENASQVSYPLWEIDQLAQKLEVEVAKLFPISLKAFNDCGRRAP